MGEHVHYRAVVRARALIQHAPGILIAPLLDEHEIFHVSS